MDILFSTESFDQGSVIPGLFNTQWQMPELFSGDEFKDEPSANDSKITVSASVNSLKKPPTLVRMKFPSPYLGKTSYRSNVGPLFVDMRSESAQSGAIEKERLAKLLQEQSKYTTPMKKDSETSSSSEEEEEEEEEEKQCEKVDEPKTSRDNEELDEQSDSPSPETSAVQVRQEQAIPEAESDSDGSNDYIPHFLMAEFIADELIKQAAFPQEVIQKVAAELKGSFMLPNVQPIPRIQPPQPPRIPGHRVDPTKSKSPSARKLAYSLNASEKTLDLDAKEQKDPSFSLAFSSSSFFSSFPFSSSTSSSSSSSSTSSASASTSSSSFSSSSSSSSSSASSLSSSSSSSSATEERKVYDWRNMPPPSSYEWPQASKKPQFAHETEVSASRLRDMRNTGEYCPFPRRFVGFSEDVYLLEHYLAQESEIYFNNDEMLNIHDTIFSTSLSHMASVLKKLLGQEISMNRFIKVPILKRLLLDGKIMGPVEGNLGYIQACRSTFSLSDTRQAGKLLCCYATVPSLAASNHDDQTEQLAALKEWLTEMVAFLTCFTEFDWETAYHTVSETFLESISMNNTLFFDLTMTESIPLKNVKRDTQFKSDCLQRVDLMLHLALLVCFHVYETMHQQVRFVREDADVKRPGKLRYNRRKRARRQYIEHCHQGSDEQDLKRRKVG